MRLILIKTALLFCLFSCNKKAEFIYPESKNGVINLLALPTETVLQLNMDYGLYVQLPKGKHIKVIITNLSTSLISGELIMGWFFDAFPDAVSWIVGDYHDESNTQIFKSQKKGTECSMELFFVNNNSNLNFGKARIDVYEGSKTVTKSIVIYW